MSGRLQDGCIEKDIKREVRILAEEQWRMQKHRREVGESHGYEREDDPQALVPFPPIHYFPTKCSPV